MRDYPSDRVDLRSDTVTQPTPSMREAMIHAKVGDDVLGDDPTVTQLEQRLAALCGKEAALFVPSGTMSNAIALRAHTSPGDEIITAKNSHIYLYEGGGYAALCGASIALVDVYGGLMRVEDVERAIRKQAGSLSHYPDGSLVCVENTSNRGGGACYPQETLDAIAALAKENDCATHMDGARIFNAAVATNTSVARMVRDYDSISICFSKGLGAPVGSVLGRFYSLYCPCSPLEERCSVAVCAKPGSLQQHACTHLTIISTVSKRIIVGREYWQKRFTKLKDLRWKCTP